MLIEWADRLDGALPPDRLNVRIEGARTSRVSCGPGRDRHRRYVEAGTTREVRGDRAVSVAWAGSSRSTRPRAPSSSPREPPTGACSPRIVPRRAPPLAGAAARGRRASWSGPGCGSRTSAGSSWARDLARSRACASASRPRRRSRTSSDGRSSGSRHPMRSWPGRPRARWSGCRPGPRDRLAIAAGGEPELDPGRATPVRALGHRDRGDLAVDLDGRAPEAALGLRAGRRSGACPKRSFGSERRGWLPAMSDDPERLVPRYEPCRGAHAARRRGGVAWSPDLR